MKCLYCNSEWNTPASMGLSLKFCPFCGKDLKTEDNTARKYTTNTMSKYESSTNVQDPDFDIENEVLYEYRGKGANPRVPYGVRVIAGDAFFENQDIQTVHLPKTIEEIGESAFFGCKNLQSIHLPEGLKKIGICAFTSSGLREVELPGSLEEMEQECFEDTRIEYVKIPPRIRKIDSSVFSGCKELRKVEISDGVEEIDEGAFAVCTKLTTVVIPDSVTSIATFPGDESFFGSDHIDTVIASARWKRNNPDLLVTMIPSQREEENFLIEEDVLLRYYGREAVPYIPSAVTVLGGNAFRYNSHIRMIKIPENVRTIKEEAFSYCDNLTRVILSDSVEKIETSVFYGCKHTVELVASDSWKRRNADVIRKIMEKQQRGNM